MYLIDRQLPGVRTSCDGVKIILLLVALLVGQAWAGPARERIATTGDSTAFTHNRHDTTTFVSPVGIIITAPRIAIPLKENPAATSVVGREALGSLAKSIAPDEALRTVPGVKIDNQADGKRIHMSIRGQGILSERGLRGIRAMLDGIPLSEPSGYTPDLYDVDWSTLRQIEVLRGPAASLYGGSASGGVLNLTTLDGGPSPLQGTLSANYGSYNFWKTLGQFGGSSEDVNYRVGLSRTMGDGYRDHTKYWGNNLYGTAAWSPLEGLKVTPVFGWTDFFNENAEGLNQRQAAENPIQANPDAGPKNEYIRTQRFTTGASAHYAIDGMHDIAASVFVRRTTYGESVPASVLHRKMTAPGFSLQYTWQTRGEAVRNAFGVGADLQWQTIDQYKHANLGFAVEGYDFLSNDGIDQHSTGFFAFDRVELGDQWSVIGNLRSDNIHNALTDNFRSGGVDLSGSADFSKVTGKIGVTWQASESTSLYANWGTGYLPPATEELANNPDAQGGFNRHLEAATSQSEEIGVRSAIGSDYFIDCTLFAMTTDNDFDRYRVPTRPLETFYRNAGSTRRYGAEIYLRWLPLDAATLEAAYTYSNFKYTMATRTRVLMDDTTIVKYVEDGNWLPNSPEHQLSLNARYEIVSGLSVTATMDLLSRTYIDGANVASESVPGFALFGAEADYRIRIGGTPCTFFAAAKNLFDRRYIAFTEPDPGGNSYQPGPGQEFFGGIRLELGGH